MPVILEQVDWPTWLGETDDDPTALMRPAGDGVLRRWAVSRRVKSPRHNGADLLDEILLPDRPVTRLKLDRTPHDHRPPKAARHGE
jgi:hypothetical protein